MRHPARGTRAGRRLGKFAAVLLVLGLVAAACGGKSNNKTPAGTSGESGKPVKGGTLIDYQDLASGDQDHIDPATASTIQGSQIPQLVYDGLTDIDYRTGKLKPAVAESWSSNADATVWTFKLRKTNWSDGQPVLPSDFAYAWARVLDPKLASELTYHITDNAKIKGAADVAAGKATTLSGVEADDANMTLKVTLDAPLSFFPDILAHNVFSPVPKHLVSKLTDQSQWEQGIMVGNGPFKMKEPWKHDQYIKLVRNDSYWGGVEGHKAYLDEVDFMISKDEDSAYAAFEAGTGQTALIPSARYSEVIAKYPGHNTADKSMLGTYYWGFNQKDPTVGGDKNLLLRQAISEAIDRDAINKTAYNDTRQVATGFTPPGMPGYKANLSSVTTRNVEDAKAKVAQWRQANGNKAVPTLKLNFNAGAGHDVVATIIQSNLKDIGINSTLAPGDSKTYFSNMKKGQGQLLRAGWIYDYVAYDNGITPLFSTAAIGGDNLELYSNPQVDQMIAQARGTKDEAARNKIYNDIEKIILDNVIVIPLNWYKGQIVYANNVHNFVESPLDFVAYDDIWLK